MILNRELYVENDEKKTVHLRTTFDTSVAQELVREANANGGARTGSGDGEMAIMGYIPPEMWTCDPWLIMATRARRAGDMGEYTKMLKKFFEVHREYKVLFHRKYWNGSSAKE